MWRLAALVAVVGAALAALAVGRLVIKARTDDAILRCSAATPGKGLVLTNNGHYRSLGPGDITLRWSWKRRDYLCVYRYGNGRELVRPAAKTIDG